MPKHVTSKEVGSSRRAIITHVPRDTGGHGSGEIETGFFFSRFITCLE